jgi:hypothetical protein
MILTQRSPTVTDVLNQLLHLLLRGLPAYVVEANPWTEPQSEGLRKALANLAGDRRLFANLAAQAILDRGDYPDPGTFPLEYTGLNDVSIAFLTQEIIHSLHIDIEVLPEISAQLATIPHLHDLTEEILGNSIGHAEILEEMLKAE